MPSFGGERLTSCRSSSRYIAAAIPPHRSRTNVRTNGRTDELFCVCRTGDTSFCRSLTLSPSSPLPLSAVSWCRRT